MRIVITRPAEDTALLAAELRRLGHVPEIYPLLEITYPQLPSLTIDGVTALVVTSRNALRGLFHSITPSEALCALPLYAVGAATANFAHQHGFIDVRTGAGTARELVPLITSTANPNAGALLYLTGEHLAFDLEAALAAEGLTVRRIITYEAHEASGASIADLVEKLQTGAVNGVILMSPRTATIFVRILARVKLPQEPCGITCYCASETIAKPLRHFAELPLESRAIGQKRITIKVAQRPTEIDLLALIGAGQ
jgi:uroporphyrinogen-III synthase